jgi:hypothetical protein
VREREKYKRLLPGPQTPDPHTIFQHRLFATLTTTATLREHRF